MSKEVKIVCHDGSVYIGTADGYQQPVDEDDGFSSICVMRNGGGWCLKVNEIERIEETTGDKA